ncbi:Jmjc domain-containing protein 7 [Plakobranchus ocellatus]|uniref:Jmjc domain-containing protein 7 n=1 Tax=Plakobranchus ocellatus TaxID=259542 RepID=A0AAV4CPK2_9GAST|nr:Jmjc domain-containing protein 7 [Plakobranchus ocellatus]
MDSEGMLFKFIKWIFSFCMLTKIVIVAPKLNNFDSNAILNSCEFSCVVASLDKVTTVKEVSDLIQSLADVSFRNEPTVVVGRLGSGINLERFWPNSKPLVVQGGLDRKTVNQSIFIFKRLKKDRTCLLRPHKSLNIPDVAQHKVFSKEMKRSDAVSIAVNIINENCRSFRNVDGSINIGGLHRNEILNNLFQAVKEEIKSHDVSNSQHLQDKKTQYCSNKIFYSSVDGVCKKKNLQDHYDECERIPVPTSFHFFNEYLTQSKPVIITGATEKWPAFQKWTNKFLRAKYGKTRIHIKATPNGEYEGVEDKSLWEGHEHFNIPKQVQEQLLHPDLVVVRPASLDMPFSNFLDLIEDVSKGITVNISAYLEYSSIDDYFPELNSDIKEFDFMHMLKLASLNIWLSDGKTLGKLHFDPFDNLLCQISGEKHVTLFNPHNNERLYEGHIQESQFTYNKSAGSFSRSRLLDSTSMVMSPVDLKRPDLKRFPLFAGTHPLKCSIKAGEVLFMPAFWWHEVQSKPNVTENRNMAVNFWYKPFLTKEFPCAECRLDVNQMYDHLL